MGFRAWGFNSSWDIGFGLPGLKLISCCGLPDINVWDGVPKQSKD